MMRNIRPRAVALYAVACILLLAQFGVALTAAAASYPRLWSQATPAAGVAIRSAANFRAFVISTGGTASVDICQINSDGTTTKLGTIVASPTGTYSAGTYVTQNMAAIFWRFTSAPPASYGPPAVSVTFINDVPAIPLASLYYPTPPQTPFTTGDSSLLLDIDLRNGAPAGWVNSGTGTFDATNGYTPGFGSTSGLANTLVGAFASAAQLSQGTVAVRFQRTGVSTDNSFGSHFWDSTGNTQNATTQSRQLFEMRSSSGAWTLQALVAAGTIPALRILAQTNSMSGPTYFYWQTVNSHFVPGYQDPVFADLVFTWFQNQYYVFFDGHLITTGVLGDVPIYAMFENICIGNSDNTGAPSGAPFGSYGIQRLQVSNRFLGPAFAGPTIGLLPDSFAAAYTQRATPTATGADGSYQVSDIDAVQTGLGLYEGIAALTYNPGQTAVFHQIQALMFRSYGFYPPIYNAGQPGHGYSSINAPIDDAYIAALNQAAPSIIMAGGTINDVSTYTPSDGNLIADTEAVMDRLVAGGGTRIIAPANPALEEIVYLETLSSQAMPNIGSYPEPAYATESQNIISLTRSSLTGFAPVGSVAFSYVTSKEWWNQASAYATYLYGSTPADPFNAVGGNDYANPHPDPTGYSVIASHLYAPISNALLNTAGADLSLTGSASVLSATIAAFNISVANAGPLVAAGTVVTAVLPTGVTLVSGSSSTGCSQSGNTVSCLIASLAAGQSVPIRVTLQAAGAVPGSLTFAAGNSNGNDPNAANDSVTMSSPFGAGASADGPVPIWAVALLGAGLLGIASRRLKAA